MQRASVHRGSTQFKACGREHENLKLTVCHVQPIGHALRSFLRQIPTILCKHYTTIYHARTVYVPCILAPHADAEQTLFSCQRKIHHTTTNTKTPHLGDLELKQGARRIQAPVGGSEVGFVLAELGQRVDALASAVRRGGGGRRRQRRRVRYTPGGRRCGCERLNKGTVGRYGSRSVRSAPPHPWPVAIKRRTHGGGAVKG